MDKATFLREMDAKLLRGIANETRIQIINLLAKRPRTLKELIERTGREPQNLAPHLKTLEGLNLIRHERHGKGYVYSLTDERANAIALSARLLTKSVAASLVTESEFLMSAYYEENEKNKEATNDVDKAQ